MKKLSSPEESNLGVTWANNFCPNHFLNCPIIYSNIYYFKFSTFIFGKYLFDTDTVGALVKKTNRSEEVKTMPLVCSKVVKKSIFTS